MASKTNVVITRKHKRLNKGAHGAAFILTGGASAPVSAARAATNAGYNARTRQMQGIEPTRMSWRSLLMALRMQSEGIRDAKIIGQQIREDGHYDPAKVFCMQQASRAARAKG